MKASKQAARRRFERELAEAVASARNDVMNRMSLRAVELGAPVGDETLVASVLRAWCATMSEIDGTAVQRRA